MRRVYKQGNSLVISFPVWQLDLIDVSCGDMVGTEVVKGNCIKVFKSQTDILPKRKVEKETDA